MEHRVVYPGPEPVGAVPVRKPDRIRPLTAAFLLLLTLGVRQFWPAGTEVLRQWLLPGAPSIQPVLDTFAGHLANGDSIGEAVTALCKEVLHEHGI